MSHDTEDDSLDPPTTPGEGANPVPPRPPAEAPRPSALTNELSQGRLPESARHYDPAAKPPRSTDASGLRPDPYGESPPGTPPRPVYEGPSRTDTGGLRRVPYEDEPGAPAPPAYEGPGPADTSGLRRDPYLNAPAHSPGPARSPDPAGSRSADGATSAEPPSGPHSARVASTPPPSGSDGRLPAVRLGFSSDEDDAPGWRVARLAVEEGLSETYLAVVDLVADDAPYDIGSLLGRSATLEIARDHGARRVLGIVARVDRLGGAAGKLVVRAHVVPAFALLRQTCDSRIFQDKTVPEILEAVLAEAFAPYERELRLALSRPTYATRDYCVQYRESDHDFVVRLCAEEGIGFHFEHSGDREVMTFFDANDALPPCMTIDGDAVPMSSGESGVEVTEVVRTFEWTRTLDTTSVVLREHDWTRPRLELTFANRGEDARGRDRERYEYPGAFTVGGYDEGTRRHTADDGATRARIAREAHARREQTGRGTTQVVGLVAGGTVEIAGHASADLDRKYVVVRTRHEGRAPELLVGGGSEATEGHALERYHNVFECIPADVPWRPTPSSERTRATVRGPQTAIVVGPSGEEIHTDAHGRVKVQLHWDREGSRDDHSSCWLRVAQRWAGAGWGFLFLPRVGMEVIVDFLEGDPDRPLVTGCVYDGQSPPPYDLPARKTVSTIKSQSSPGGNGFNELRFEDAAGEEEMFVHAQRNLVEKVLHDHATSVGHDHSNRVAGNDSESVGGAQSLSVGGDRTQSVAGHESRSVGRDRSASVGGNELLDVRGSRGLRVVGDEQHAVHGSLARSTDLSETRTVGGDRTTRVEGKDVTTVGLTSSITAQIHNELKQGLANGLVLRGDHAELSTPEFSRLLAPGAQLEVKRGGEVSIVASTSIKLVVGQSWIHIEESGITVHSTSKVTCVSAGSAVVAQPDKVHVVAPNVTTEAVGQNTIKGALVAIN